MAKFRFNLTTDRFAGGLGLIGVGIFAIAPATVAPTLGVAFILAGLLVLLWDAKIEDGHLVTYTLRGVWATTGARRKIGIAIIFAALACGGLFISTRRSETNDPVIAATVDALPTMSIPQGASVPSEDPPTNLSQDQIISRISLWEHVNSLTDSVIECVNVGYKVEDDVQAFTPSNKANILGEIDQFKDCLTNISNRIDNVANQYSSYRDDYDAINYPRFGNILKAADDLDSAIKAAPPQTGTFDLSLPSGKLGIELKDAADWRGVVQRLTQQNLAQLRPMLRQ